MRTGDAECTVWLEGRSGRSYALEVQSKRPGAFRSKRWQHPRYRWHVELWQGENDDAVRESPVRVVKTFAAAMRAARRLADQWERAAAKKITTPKKVSRS